MHLLFSKKDCDILLCSSMVQSVGGTRYYLGWGIGRVGVTVRCLET